MIQLITLFCIIFALVSCNNEPVMYEGYEVVDLGLPSGTLWATCNVGADAPEQQGAYFAWGETEEKDSYDEYNYKFYDDDARFRITKYSTDSIDRWEGWMDNLTILEPQDDAATVHWGSDYRMPTREEFEELLEYCTWEWDTINYRSGCRLIGKYGASIFLPAAGGRYAEGRYSQGGLMGGYWSSSLCTYTNMNAYALEFDIMACKVKHVGYNRECGYSVRPVYSHKKK